LSDGIVFQISTAGLYSMMAHTYLDSCILVCC